MLVFGAAGLPSVMVYGYDGLRRWWSPLMRGDRQLRRPSAPQTVGSSSTASRSSTVADLVRPREDVEGELHGPTKDGVLQHIQVLIPGMSFGSSLQSGRLCGPINTFKVGRSSPPEGVSGPADGAPRPRGTKWNCKGSQSPHPVKSPGIFTPDS